MRDTKEKFHNEGEEGKDAKKISKDEMKRKVDRAVEKANRLVIKGDIDLALKELTDCNTEALKVFVDSSIELLPIFVT